MLAVRWTISCHALAARHERGGRAIALRLAETCAPPRAAAASRGRTSSRALVARPVQCWPRRCATVEAPLHAGLAAGGRRLASAAGRACAPHDGTRWPRDARLRRACRAQNHGGAVAGPPPLRRVSGDVVTAGLFSSRVWFGPVPGSP
ncbi:hypothetical protein F511_09831 [Dorcoceras hygrometricum]|uniref:Uncharacterized protein n=1 Tax=Dorcoceras hygrometricum TaxID=472368 RepID=A0A2Z7C8M3_9LAMI|nr:hypothetical protein F511_09831 [Dorcoceras hygrometricum]